MANGLIHNQEAFLNKISASLGRERRKDKVIRPVWKKQPQYNVFKGETQDELVQRLKAQCERIHTSFEEVTTKELPEKLAEVIERFQGEKIISWKDERFSQFGLDPLFSSLEDKGKSIHTWNPEDGEKNIELAEKADIGITFSDMTLAESGTVVLLSDANKGRSVSLLPTSYIAIIPKSTVVPRMTQAARHLHELAQQEGRFPSCVNFISGPSNSADIEMNLVVGVHGPIRACYIVVDDQ
ncbi:lactate utilization protein C [Alkalihalobacillus sp. MEB130]|uniref:LutC/YkgG family protein n=1 Tax=Alkalihalobacillus sp. MEB130 TaxID=2976704 RepID=UPI0028E0457A|nr:lactate utilization protein C [Alkalihalobacillus sp. MEB130]MDT8861524.1 lactate utilization protein C [Alkalihalobacillus sp. MEB130]